MNSTSCIFAVKGKKKCNERSVIYRVDFDSVFLYTSTMDNDEQCSNIKRLKA